MKLSGLFSNLRLKFQGAKHGPPAVPQNEIPVLKLLFFIVDWNKANAVTDIFIKEKVHLHFISKGKGTANSEILDLLGIGATEKAVIICLEQDILVPVLLKEVRKKLGLYNPGTGIAFTVPLSAINDPILLVFTKCVSKNDDIVTEEDNVLPKGGNMADENTHASHGSFTHDLIIAIVNQGYCDELMNTAREAGASGGTVINARGQAHEGTVKFFGISVQDEKEMIFILSNREKKTAIMQAVCESHGLKSKAQGIVFSLPVESVTGLSFE